MNKNKVIFNQLLVCDADHLMLPADAYGSLSGSERLRLAQIANAQQAKLFLLGRYLVRQLLASAMQLTPQQIPIAINHKGKPSLLMPNSIATDWYFNISHTGSLLALAIGNQAPLGVDLESRLLSSAQIQRLAKRYFNEKEQVWLAQHPDPAHFLRLWTLKEAVLKAHGSGIANNLNAVHWLPYQAHALFGEQRYQLQHFLLSHSPIAQDKEPSRLTLAIQTEHAAPLTLLKVADLGLMLEINGPQPNLYVSQ
ncbi:4'-phosphopantetheinyl transferase family protein [Oceanisphaera sp. W20_SRM_FM3]|uniref:4'-phosphopantetheinyl transferase family protein n=1 Tax=Oceanisphaera sp. W20_SRM_FM3 TaxID=3240267 RepID=UPI003F9E4092